MPSVGGVFEDGEISTPCCDLHHTTSFAAAPETMAQQPVVVVVVL